VVDSMHYRKVFAGVLGTVRARSVDVTQLAEKELRSPSPGRAHVSMAIQRSAERDAVVDVEDPWQRLIEVVVALEGGL
jgi:hypothetical protein